MHTCACAAAAPQADASSLLRRLLEKDDKWRDTVKRETQGAAWTSSKGQYAGAVDAFTKFSAEATSTSSYNGIYFNSGEGRSHIHGLGMPSTHSVLPDVRLHPERIATS